MWSERRQRERFGPIADVTEIALSTQGPSAVLDPCCAPEEHSAAIGPVVARFSAAFCIPFHLATLEHRIA